LSTTAARAASFVQSIGVNTHLNDGGPYGNLSLVMTELQYLGTKEIRDHNPYSWSVSNFQTLASQGVKLDLIIGYNPYYELGSGALQSDLYLIDEIAQAVPGSIMGLEGLNEPSMFPDYWYGQLTDNWNTVLQVQQAEYTAVNTDPLLQSVPLLNSSVWYSSFSGTPPDFSPYADIGNGHVYPYGGRQPGWFMNNALWEQQQIVPGTADWITEFGYSTTPGDPTYGVDAATQAKNILNGLADAFKAGIPHTFIYELSDWASNIPSNQAWGALGLFNYDGTPKPAASAIHNLTSVLADSGNTAATFTPASLSYSISGLPSTGNSLLLEKSDGTFDILVWNEAPDWNPSTESEISVQPIGVTLSLGAAYSNISVFDPLKSAAPIASYSNTTSVQLSVTDHPLIVQLSGSTVSSTPDPALTQSTDDTVVTAAGQSIVDGNGNLWMIVNGQVAINGVVDPITSSVIKLAYVKGKIWQENSYNLWWAKSSPSDSWSPPYGTSVPPISISVTKNSTGATTVVDATVVQSETDYQATINLTAPGVAQVTLGSLSDTLQFLGMSSINLTAGSATATVLADGGTNTFNAGHGALEVSGGSGLNTYIYASGDARLTVDDFSAAQGDLLSIDKTLESSMVQSPDGQGGTLLTFGTGGGIDLKGISTLPLANIHWY
jgi:hypothetical protein